MGRRGALVPENGDHARQPVRLTIRGYAPEIADEYMATVTKQARFLRRVSFLF